jgi:hypothetical protein
VAALNAAGGEEQARRLALRLIRTLLDGDEPALRSLFDAIVSRTRLRREVDRADIIEECLDYARQLRWRSDMEVGDVIDADGIDVSRWRGTAPGGGRVPGIVRTDLVVRIPLRGVGPRPVPRCFHRSAGVAEIVVRPGLRPLVVGVHR